MSRGLPNLRMALARLYERNWGVALDPETEITNTIGSKEGFSHLMWVLLQSGDAAIVPSPSYPIHIYGPLFAGADLRQVPMGTDADFFEGLDDGLAGGLAQTPRARSSRSRTTPPEPASTCASCSASSTSVASTR